MPLLSHLILPAPPQHGAGADIFTANMYLAEDRVRNSRNASLFYSINVRPFRSCAGNWFRSAAGRGYFTMSSRRMASPILRIRWGFYVPKQRRAAYILADLTRFRFQSWSRNAGGGSMARSLLRFTARSSSITYTARRIPSRANSGFTSSSSIKHSILSFPGSPLCAPISFLLPELPLTRCF